MRRAGLRGVMGRRKRPRIERPDAIALDRVDRAFTRTEPDQLWVTDITQPPTREGKVFCCVVLDAFSRRVVGWSIDGMPTAALVTNALGMAVNSRSPDAGTLIHSDQGTQFTSWAFTHRAKASGLVPSMGSIGDCYDCDDARAVAGGLTLATTDEVCPCVDVSATQSGGIEWPDDRAGSDLIGA